MDDLADIRVFPERQFSVRYTVFQNQEIVIQYVPKSESFRRIDSMYDSGCLVQSLIYDWFPVNKRKVD